MEDYDWTNYGFEDGSRGFSDIGDAILEFMTTAGFERDYGRRLVSDMEATGLTEVRGEGRARLIDPTSPGFDFFRLSFESLREAIVKGIRGHNISRRSKLNNGSSREIRLVINFHTDVRFGEIMY